MTEQRADRALSERDAHRTGATIPAGLLAVLIVAALVFAGIAGRYWARGDFDVIHILLSLFFSVNLVICFWEMCLFFRRDYVEKRAEYWDERRLSNSLPIRFR